MVSIDLVDYVIAPRAIGKYAKFLPQKKCPTNLDYRTPSVCNLNMLKNPIFLRRNITLIRLPYFNTEFIGKIDDFKAGQGL